MDGMANNFRIDIDEIKKGKRDQMDGMMDMGTSNIELTQLDERLDTIENRIENLEIQDRQSIVILDGIEVEPEKTLAESVKTQMNANMDVNLKDEEIVQCSFLGRPTQPGTKRPIKVRLNDRRLKKTLMRKKGQLKPTRIFVV